MINALFLLNASISACPSSVNTNNTNNNGVSIGSAEIRLSESRVLDSFKPGESSISLGLVESISSEARVSVESRVDNKAMHTEGLYKSTKVEIRETFGLGNGFLREKASKKHIMELGISVVLFVALWRA